MTVETPDLAPCPFCGASLFVRHGEGGYGRCDTAGCWMHERKLTVPLDAPRQVSEWNRRAPSADLDASRAQVARMREALGDATVSLMAAISLLESGDKAAKKAASSDRMFDQMLKDYRASVARARTALQETQL